MKELQQRELQKALRLIESMGCKFKVITPDGESFGDLVIAEQKKKRPRSLHFPFGSMSAYYKPFIDLNLKVGDVIEIPYSKFKKEKLRSSICSYLIKHWGKGAYTTMQSNGAVQIMRTEMKGAAE